MPSFGGIIVQEVDKSVFVINAIWFWMLWFIENKKRDKATRSSERKAVAVVTSFTDFIITIEKNEDMCDHAVVCGCSWLKWYVSLASIRFILNSVA